jgi:hypothetical protein
VGDNSRLAPEISLAELHVADSPELWEALGFEVRDEQLQLGAVRIVLGAEGRGIVRWAVGGVTGDIDGLPTAPARTPSRPNPVPHPNGATGIDHVVITTPDFDRTAQALTQAGIPLKRTRDAGGSRQGFRRLGPAILELVEANKMPPGPARFWGLTLIVEDLQSLAGRLHDRLGEIKPAVQPGRHIATLRASAGLGQPMAFMDPER